MSPPAHRCRALRETREGGRKRFCAGSRAGERRSSIRQSASPRAASPPRDRLADVYAEITGRPEARRPGEASSFSMRTACRLRWLRAVGRAALRRRVGAVLELGRSCINLTTSDVSDGTDSLLGQTPERLELRGRQRSAPPQRVGLGTRKPERVTDPSALKQCVVRPYDVGGCRSLTRHDSPPFVSRGKPAKPQALDRHRPRQAIDRHLPRLSTLNHLPP